MSSTGREAVRAYLGLGTNVGERRGNLRRAVALLRKAGRPGGRPYARVGTIRARRVSVVYETEPQIVKGQPWFLNQVVEVETTLTPAALLGACLRIEKAMGRVRGRRYGPRVMDIDVLLYGGRVIKAGRPQGRPLREAMQIPHPRLHERRFVLKPLADLAPDLVHPIFGKTIRVLLRDCPARGQAVRRKSNVNR